MPAKRLDVDFVGSIQPGTKTQDPIFIPGPARESRPGLELATQTPAVSCNASRQAREDRSGGLPGSFGSPTRLDPHGASLLSVAQQPLSLEPFFFFFFKSGEESVASGHEDVLARLPAEDSV